MCTVATTRHPAVVGTHRLASDNVLLVCIVDPALARSQAPAPVFSGGPGNARTLDLCAQPALPSRDLLLFPGIQAPAPQPTLPEASSSGCSSSCLALSIALPLAVVALVLAGAALLFLRRGCARRGDAKDTGSQSSIPVTSRPSINRTSQLSASYMDRSLSAEEPALSDVGGCCPAHA